MIYAGGNDVMSNETLAISATVSTCNGAEAVIAVMLLLLYGRFRKTFILRGLLAVSILGRDAISNQTTASAPD